MQVTVKQIEGVHLPGAVTRGVVALLVISPLVALLALRVAVRSGGLPVAAVIGVVVFFAAAIVVSVLKLRHSRRIVMTGLAGPVIICQGTYKQVWEFLQLGGTYTPLEWFGQDVRLARSDVLIDIGATPAVLEFVNAWGPPSHGRRGLDSHTAGRSQ